MYLKFLNWLNLLLIKPCIIVQISKLAYRFNSCHISIYSTVCKRPVLTSYVGRDFTIAVFAMHCLPTGRTILMGENLWRNTRAIIGECDMMTSEPKMLAKKKRENTDLDVAY